MRLEDKVDVDASPEAVWTVVRDPLTIGGLDDRVIVRELEPGTEPALGARYRVLIEVGRIPVGGNVEIIQFVENRELCWTTLTGVDHRLRLRIRETPNGSRVTLRFGYDSPGILGSVVDLVAYTSLRSTLRDLLRRVVSEVESGATSGA